MTRLHLRTRLCAWGVFCLTACSMGAPDRAPLDNATSPAEEARKPSLSSSSSGSSPSPMEAATTNEQVIGLEGLGALRLGQPVPKSSGWTERGGQSSDDCRTVSSPDHPGVYGMVVAGKLRRITVGQRSDVKLAEGISVGDTEPDVRKWFAGFRAEPHKYESVPAKYLTAPNAATGDPALRFEIGQDGKVSMIHVGMMPELAYVEGCA